MPTTLLAMVKHNLGISVLPANAEQLDEAAGVVYRPMGKPMLTRKVCIFQLRNRSLSTAAALLLDSLIRYTRDARV